MSRFEGFADAQAKFFRRLAKNQNREWFQAHKEEFELGYNEPMKALLAELREALDPLFPHADLDEPKVLRIYRDVRFSKDKSPYKTHIGGMVPTKRAGKSNAVPAALYFHLGTEIFAAAGHYMMDGPDLARFRAAVADDARGKELEGIVAKLRKKGFKTESHGALKRAPRGFDPEHPRGELLKVTGLVAMFPALPAEILKSRKLVSWLVARSKEVAPFVEWLVFATA
ncbi:MAG TPA: DUF2461 domain-containing protein [Polyangiaceae bacterium]|jgi:uncharacterized protein (TIGR02453 family)